MGRRILAVLIFAVLIALAVGIGIVKRQLWGVQVAAALLLLVALFAAKALGGRQNQVSGYLAEYVTLFSLLFLEDLIHPLESRMLLLLDRTDWGRAQELFVRDALSTILYLAVVAVTWGLASLLHYLLLADKTVMRRYEGRLAEQFKGLRFREMQEAFCQQLALDLNRIDREVQWNDYYFTPLEAEVTIQDGQVRRSTGDLVRALRSKSRERLFLVLGDPGSGKSTLLRKLAKDLLEEVRRTRKIPLYINLREWSLGGTPTPENPPGPMEFLDFVKSNLTDRLSDIMAAEFIEKYFDLLYENGQLYLILDSFDEIPFLLDEPEESWLVDRTSAVLYQVCAGHKDSRAILSSRFFRKPTDQYRARVQMEILPFRDSLVHTCMERMLENDVLARRIFTERRELLPLARNPFYASLLTLYYKRRQQLPANEMELFDDFIDTRLDQCERSYQMLSAHGLDKDEVRLHAMEIAGAIFTGARYGIEIPERELMQGHSVPAEVLQILQTAKLIRRGGAQKKLISFSHRRFNEYFMARILMREEIAPMLNSIPANSKWRDTLVLYAQICPREKARELLDFCTEVIDSACGRERIEYDQLFRQALYCLDFLVSAFSANPGAAHPYCERIMVLVNLLLESNNLLYRKYAVQAVPILPQGEVARVLDRALGRYISWINDDILCGCASLPDPDDRMRKRFGRYFLQYPYATFRRNRRVTMYYLNSSEAYRGLYRQCRVKLWEPCADMAVLAATALADRLFSLDMQRSIVMLLFLLVCKYSRLDVNRVISFVIGTKLILVEMKPFPGGRIKEGILACMAAMLVLFAVPSLFTGNWTEAVYMFLCGACIMPKEYLFFSFAEDRRELRTFARYGLSLVGVLICVIGLISLDWFKKVMDWLAIFFGYLTGGIGALFAIYLLARIVRWLKYLRRDKRLCAGYEFFPFMDRGTIYGCLQRLNTSVYQGRYIDRLIRDNVQAAGDWSDLGFPDLADEKDQVRLARLEEKWLKQTPPAPPGPEAVCAEQVSG